MRSMTVSKYFDILLKFLIIIGFLFLVCIWILAAVSRESFTSRRAYGHFSKHRLNKLSTLLKTPLKLRRALIIGVMDSTRLSHAIPADFSAEFFWVIFQPQFSTTSQRCSTGFEFGKRDKTTEGR